MSEIEAPPSTRPAYITERRRMPPRARPLRRAPLPVRPKKARASSFFARLAKALWRVASKAHTLFYLSLVLTFCAAFMFVIVEFSQSFLVFFLLGTLFFAAYITVREHGRRARYLLEKERIVYYTEYPWDVTPVSKNHWP
jgi:hypothetical protein